MERLVFQKMKTLEEQQSVATKVSLPTEVIEEIISRLPVESILRFRSVSKPWLSSISSPAFTKQHFTRATADHRATLFISAYNPSTRRQYFFSAALDGGPVTRLMALHHAHPVDTIKSEHLNGLVCISCTTLFPGYPQAFIVNPSTRKIFEIPDPDSKPNFTCEDVDICYLFGFEESINEHKILLIIRKLFRPIKVEFMIFSLSTHSWRKIDVEPPIGFSWDRLYYGTKSDSVCVNSVIHVMALDLSFKRFDILAFDLGTEKFSVISFPQGVEPQFFLQINGCLGVVCHDRVLESKVIDIWILQDYDNHVWVRETVKFPESWIDFGRCFPPPLGAINMDEIIISSRKLSRNVMSVPVYNKKTECFKSLQFNLGHQVPYSETLQLDQIGCYIESMVSL